MRSAALLVLLSLSLSAADWTRFRGPNGSGVAGVTGLPVEFGPQKNLLWKTPLPRCHSSPILAAGRIFLTAFEGEKLLTLGLDGNTGKILWQRGIVRTRQARHHDNNNAASPSPVTDGSSVYAFFQDFGLVSYSAAGEERWKLPLGPFENYHGMGASPILAGGAVIQVCDQDVGSFIVAVDKDTGKVRWRKDRPEAAGNGFATPVVAADGAVVVLGARQIAAYGADSGERVWWRAGLPRQPKGSPVVGSGGALFLNVQTLGDERGLPPFDFAQLLSQFDSNKDGRFTRDDFLATMPRFNEPFTQMDSNGDGELSEKEFQLFADSAKVENTMMSFRPEGRGDLSEAKPLWKRSKGLPNVPSLLVYQDVLYTVKEGGIFSSHDPSTGEVYKQGRLQGALDHYFASPVAADGKIYLVSRDGHAVVLKAGREWEILAVNALDEECFATPALAEGRIYLRTTKALYAFGHDKTDLQANLPGGSGPSGINDLPVANLRRRLLPSRRL